MAAKPQPVYTLPLSSFPWFYRQASSTPVSPPTEDTWQRATAFPSELHVELLKAKKIPDPYYAFNEQQIQWIGDVEWEWRCQFTPSDIPTFSSNGGGDAVKGIMDFEGLDTICTVTLNDKIILESDNMFQSHTVPVSLSTSSSNELLLRFRSARKHGQELEAKHGKVRAGSTNLGDPSRVYVRKAQYAWRWDWGPEVMTSGPYRPITFKAYDTRVKEVATYATLSSPDNLDKAKLRVDIFLDGTVQPSSTCNVSLKDKITGKIVHSEECAVKNDSVILEWSFNVGEEGDVRLWYPVGYGSPQLYDVIVELAHEEVIIDRYTQPSIGFRTVRLLQEPLREADEYGPGRCFVFEVNGIRMFMGGSNMIPLTNLLTTISPPSTDPGHSKNRYRALLELATHGNQNMIRVWGGGVFAFDGEEFWETCDELGLLVWHDFPFACGVYPGQLSDFVKSVEKETRDIVKRVRHHPSLALFCGNNEDYQMVLQWGDVPSLPARKIYEEVFPSIVKELTQPPPLPNSSSNNNGSQTQEQFPEISKSSVLPPTELFSELVPYPCVPYHPGSPYTGKISSSSLSSAEPITQDKWSRDGWDTADPTVGDVHQWHIWGGKERPWQEYDIMGGRFVSEFGLPSHPALETIENFAGGGKVSEKKKIHAQGPMIAQHTRAGMFERRFSIVMNDNFRVAEDLETYVFLTQLMQSEGIGYAYSVWKRKWRGKGREETAGVLVWQLNDSWPGTSWAIADYFLRPKPVFYSIKRVLAPFTTGIYRTVEKSRANDRPKQFYEFGSYLSNSATLSIWAVNSTLHDRKVNVELTCADLAPDAYSSSWSFGAVLADGLSLPANQATEISDLSCPSINNSSQTETEASGRDATVGGWYPEPVSIVGNGDDNGEMKKMTTTTTSYTVVACVRVVDAETGQVLARAVDWPQPYRYLTWYTEHVDPNIKVIGRVTVAGAGDKGGGQGGSEPYGKVSLDITASRPVKCLFLTLDLIRPLQGGGTLDWDCDKVRFSDNALDLMPREMVTVDVEGYGVSKESMGNLKAAWLGRENKSPLDVTWL